MPPMDKNTASWLLHAAFAIGFAAIGFVGKMIVDDVTQLALKVDAIPEKYVAKSDYQYDQDRVLHAIELLGVKLDENAKSIESDYNRRMDKLEATLQEALKNGR